MAAPVKAWRFDVVTPGGELHSPFQETLALTRRMDASCPAGHVPPGEGCACGVYGAASFDGLAYEFRAKWGSVSPFSHPLVAGRPEPLPPDERVGDPGEAVRRIAARARRWWVLSQVSLYDAVEYREVSSCTTGPISPGGLVPHASNASTSRTPTSSATCGFVTTACPSCTSVSASPPTWCAASSPRAVRRRTPPGWMARPR